MLKRILFIFIIGLVLCSFLMVGFLSLPEIKAAVIGHLGNDLYRQALLSRDDFSLLLQKTSSRPAIQKAALKAAALSGSRVTLIARDGTVLGDSSTALNKLNELENHGTRPEVLSALKTGVGKSVRHSHTIGRDMIYLAIPVKNKSGSVMGYLRYSVPIAYASELMARLYKSILLTLFSVSALAAVLSFLFARFFSAPIERLVETTQSIARGVIPQTIIHKSRFEVGVLETAVEEMSRRLADNFKKLSDERGQTAAIIANMAEGLIAVNGEGKIIMINPMVEKLFGTTLPEAAGKLAREVIRNNEVAGLLEAALKSAALLEKEFDLFLPARRTFFAHAGPIRNERRELIGVVCVLNDVTELKKLENYRSEFVANVSHELKTPLATIHSYVQTLAGGAINDPEHNLGFLEKIDKHVMSLAALIDDILEISQLESKTGLAPLTQLDITQPVNRALETVAEKIKKKDILLRKDIAGPGLIVLGLEDHIYRAVLNLLENAANYTPEGGTISVSCNRRDREVAVSVTDTGIGIPAEHLPRIFERFYRVDQARSRLAGGTGLGLAIVKHVMNVHNGSVSVESEEGKGSIFTLAFPAYRSIPS